MTWHEIIESLFRFVREFGFPSAIVCAIGWGLYKAASVAHSTVVIPVVHALTSFLSVTQNTLKELGGTQDRQARTLQEISHSQERHGEALSEITKSQREIVEIVRKIQPTRQ